MDNVLVGIEYEFRVNSDNVVEYVTEHLKSSPIFDNLNFLDRVAPEYPPKNGVEIITTPLPFSYALDVMRQVFSFIDNIGTTSDVTGMHVNVSLTDKSFHDKNFNPAKLVTLADEEYIKQQFGLRPYVEAIGDVKSLDLSKKMQTISFSSAFLGTTCKLSRVEFRYLGGTDYQKQPEKAHNEINRIAQILIDSFSPREI